MDDYLQMGLSMLAVGMITVFFILYFVYVGGNLLIRFTNKYFPAGEGTAPSLESDDNKKKMAAIVTAVDVVTGGKGNISRIKKIN